MQFHKLALSSTLALLILVPASACSKPAKDGARQPSVQKPVVAGAFYPGDPSTLRKQVEVFINQAPKKALDGTLIGLVAPHAGYQYSGAIAGAAFRQIEGRSYSRVVVMAPSHHAPLSGAALSTKDIYRTPLGDVPIDVESVGKIIKKNTWASGDPRPYEVEHSLEVELPFLQTVLKNFKLVPMIIGAHDAGALEAMARALDEMFPAGDTLFVASTDLSHYLPYGKAVDVDKKTIAIVCENDPKSYWESVIKDESQLCGSAPVYILKRIAERRGAKLSLIEYANSGDTAGDKSRVVGYAAIAAVVPPAVGDKRKQELIKFARATLVAYVDGKNLPPLPNDPLLKKDGAAFVTLKKRGELRGCIGEIIAQGPLDSCIQRMTISAASQDPRFQPVSPDELKDITIEMSVLTPPEELPDPLAVRVGTDGLIIEKGLHRGVLLPQVPTEFGWSKEEFLEAICNKAGLPRGSWRDAKLSRFQAIVFSE